MVKSCMEQLALGSRSPLGDGGKGRKEVMEGKNFIELFRLVLDKSL